MSGSMFYVYCHAINCFLTHVFLSVTLEEWMINTCPNPGPSANHTSTANWVTEPQCRFETIAKYIVTGSLCVSIDQLAKCWHGIRNSRIRVSVEACAFCSPHALWYFWRPVWVKTTLRRILRYGPSRCPSVFVTRRPLASGWWSYKSPGLIYLGDTVVFSSTFEEPIQTLQAVFFFFFFIIIASLHFTIFVVL